MADLLSEVSNIAAEIVEWRILSKLEIRWDAEAAVFEFYTKLEPRGVSWDGRDGKRESRSFSGIVLYLQLTQAWEIKSCR